MRAYSPVCQPPVAGRLRRRATGGVRPAALSAKRKSSPSRGLLCFLSHLLEARPSPPRAAATGCSERHFTAPRHAVEAVRRAEHESSPPSPPVHLAGTERGARVRIVSPRSRRRPGSGSSLGPVVSRWSEPVRTEGRPSMPPGSRVEARAAFLPRKSARCRSARDMAGHHRQAARRRRFHLKLPGSARVAHGGQDAASSAAGA